MPCGIWSGRLTRTADFESWREASRGPCSFNHQVPSGGGVDSTSGYNVPSTQRRNRGSSSPLVGSGRGVQAARSRAFVTARTNGRKSGPTTRWLMSWTSRRLIHLQKRTGRAGQQNEMKSLVKKTAGKANQIVEWRRRQVERAMPPVTHE